jgi:MFS family permease
MRTAVQPRQIFQAIFYRDGASIFSVLEVADYRNLWIGQMVSFIGDSLAYNTMTFAIIRMAEEAGVSAGKLLSAIFVLSALPALFLGMIAGTIVDRANRKHLMIGADILRGFITLGFLLAHNTDHVWIFIVVTVALSSVSMFFFPARTALMPIILRKDQLLLANAFSQLTVTLSFVVGAALAGVMVGMADATAPAFVADSLSFFVSAYFIARISVSGKIKDKEKIKGLPQAAGVEFSRIKSAWNTLRAMTGELIVGVRYVFSDQIMRGVLISFLAMMTGLGAANVTFIPLLVNELGMKEEGLGLIRFSQTIGIILGSALVTTSLARRYQSRDLIGLSMVAFGVTTVIVSVVTNYPLMILVLFLVGLVISPPQIVASTLMQSHVPSAKLGRASGAQGTIVNVANIASMGAAGLLMDEIGARMVFMTAGVIIFCAGFVSWWVLRGVEDVSEDAEESAQTDADTSGMLDSTSVPAVE